MLFLRSISHVIHPEFYLAAKANDTPETRTIVKEVAKSTANKEPDDPAFFVNFVFEFGTAAQIAALNIEDAGQSILSEHRVAGLRLADRIVDRAKFHMRTKNDSKALERILATDRAGLVFDEQALNHAPSKLRRYEIEFALEWQHGDEYSADEFVLTKKVDAMTGDNIRALISRMPPADVAQPEVT